MGKERSSKEKERTSVRERGEEKEEGKTEECIDAVNCFFTRGMKPRVCNFLAKYLELHASFAFASVHISIATKRVNFEKKLFS